MEGRRHEIGGFVRRIAEHDALIARAFILVAGGVHALGDVRRLGVEQDFDLGGVPMEPGLFVADVLDRLARGLLDPLVRKFRGRAPRRR